MSQQGQQQDQEGRAEPDAENVVIDDGASDEDLSYLLAIGITST